MTRKLFSLLLCAFAMLLLMGASAVDSTAALLIGEEVVLAESAEDPSATQTEELPLEAVPAAAGVSPLTLVEQADSSLTIDGIAASVEICKTQRNGTTYVALAPMAQALDESAQIGWDAASGSVSVTTAKLTISAKAGQLYMVANGRYLYLPEGVQVINGKTTVPLSALTKAFDAKLSWDAATSTVMVTRGSGAIVSGDQFYNANTLFWLSRVIFAESGNQCLEGKMAVGNVVMNRVASPIFPNTVEGVLSQKNQFTTWKNGALADRIPNADSVIAAKLVMDGGVVAETEGALYFDGGSRSWAARNKSCIAVIEDHNFYR